MSRQSQQERVVVFLEQYGFWGLMAAVLLLSFVFRWYQIGYIPLNQDELSIGYNAYSILQTGMDEWGRKFPLVFQAYGDFKLPLYIYATVPFVAVFGLSGLAVKMPSLIAGVVTVFLFYTLVNRLLQSRAWGLLAAFLMAVAPWSFHLSRIGLESHLALALFLGGILSLLAFFESRSLKWMVVSGLFFGITLYTYVSYRLIVGLLLLFLGVMALMKRRSLVYPLFLAGVIFLLAMPLFARMENDSGIARFSQLGSSQLEGVTADSLERRQFCHLVDPRLTVACRVFFNRYVLSVERVGLQYARFISPSFLFVDGDSTEYLSNPQYPELFSLLLPFYLAGLLIFFRKSGDSWRLLQAWFLLAPLPSALVGNPQIVRGSAFLPMVLLVVVLGMYTLWQQIAKWKYRYVASVILFGGFLFQVGSFVVHSFFVYPYASDMFFYELPAVMADDLLALESEYDTIYFHEAFSNPHMFLAFYQAMEPIEYLESVERPEADEFGFQHPVALGVYRFGTHDLPELVCDEQNIDDDSLYVAPPDTYLPTKEVYRNFSKVHTQAKVLDITEVRGILTDAHLLKAYCAGENVEKQLNRFFEVKP